jgi:arabinogalactan oligomer/maltooligosaccharide transport system substrate-binding protein
LVRFASGVRVGLMSGIWNEIPSWLSATGSVFALGFAAAAVVIGRRMYGVESERDRVNAEARRAQDSFARKAQAARVSAWWGLSDDGRWGAFARNASETPVYQVFLTALGPDDHSDGTKVYSLMVPPSQSPIFFPIDDGLLAEKAIARRVKLSFTDSAGVRWLRNQYGLLTELQPALRVNTDPRIELLAQFEEDFHATYGVKVTFETFPRDYAQDRYVNDLQDQSGIDALVCPHDWLGDLIVRDVIEPTILSANHQNAFPNWALRALTFGNRLYGLPTTTDTVALIRNTKLAPRPPATFEQLVATGQALREVGQADEAFALRVGEHGDPFQIWPLFTSAGGWLFARTPDGEWDPSRIGLAEPESVAAFERLRSLGEAGIGVLRRSMDREEAFELFTESRTAYLISTSDALKPIREAGIPVAVSAVPAFADGEPASAFTLVHGLFIAKHGANNVIAHDLFADYLSHAHVMNALSAGIIGPVALCETTSQDPAVQQYLALCEAGTPMPSFPEMNATWRVLEEAETAVIEGIPAEATAKRAAAKLTEIFAAREVRAHGSTVVA